MFWNTDCKYMKIMYVHCGEETNISDPRIYERYWTSSWNETWKKFRPLRTHDLCDTGAALYQLSQQANWELVIMLDRLYSFLHHSAHVWFSYIYNHYSPLGRFIWIQHNNRLPVGLLVQLVERCTGLAEVMGSNPVRARIFFRPYFNCEDRFYSFLQLHCTHMIFVNLQP